MFDGAERPLTDHDLARFCLVAEPRGKIYGAAVSGVFATMLEANLAERCIARSDSNSESENVTLPGPLLRQSRRFFPHIERELDGALGMIGTRTGSLKTIMIPSATNRSSVPSYRKMSSPMLS